MLWFFVLLDLRVRYSGHRVSHLEGSWLYFDQRGPFPFHVRKGYREVERSWPTLPGYGLQGGGPGCWALVSQRRGPQFPLLLRWDFLNGGYKVHGVKRGVSLGQVDKGVCGCLRKKKKSGKGGVDITNMVSKSL